MFVLSNQVVLLLLTSTATNTLQLRLHFMLQLRCCNYGAALHAATAALHFRGATAALHFVILRHCPFRPARSLLPLLLHTATRTATSDFDTAHWFPFRMRPHSLLLRTAWCHLVRLDSVAEPVRFYGETVAVVDAELPV